MARRLLRRFSIGAGVHRNVGIADVVISGGGIVGSALACALGERDRVSSNSDADWLIERLISRQENRPR